MYILYEKHGFEEGFIYADMQLGSLSTYVRRSVRRVPRVFHRSRGHGDGDLAGGTARAHQRHRRRVEAAPLVQTVGAIHRSVLWCVSRYRLIVH